MRHEFPDIGETLCYCGWFSVLGVEPVRLSGLAPS